jgi:hypothetical protein
MRVLQAIGVALIMASPGYSQAVTSGTIDTSNLATKADLAAAQAIAANAITIANAAVQPSALTPYVTQTQLNAAAASNLAIMAATTPQFVGGSSAFMTRAQLTTNYPCAANALGMIANVSDLYGSYSRTLKCQTDTVSGLYYWYPEVADGSVNITQTSGTLSVTTLGTAPTIYLSATPTGTLNVAFQTPCVPGETKHVYSPASLGLNALNLTGVVGPGTVPLAQGGDKIVTCIGGTTWKSN